MQTFDDDTNEVCMYVSLAYVNNWEKKSENNHSSSAFIIVTLISRVSRNYNNFVYEIKIVDNWFITDAPSFICDMFVCVKATLESYFFLFLLTSLRYLFIINFHINNFSARAIYWHFYVITSNKQAALLQHRDESHGPWCGLFGIPKYMMKNVQEEEENRKKKKFRLSFGWDATQLIIYYASSIKRY